MSPETFHLFNFQDYLGPNPYLHAPAVSFDMALLPQASPLAIAAYVEEIDKEFPNIRQLPLTSYSELLAQTLAQVSPLKMGLHLNQVSITPSQNCDRIALQALHLPTTRGVINLVWDWLEAISQGRDFALAKGLRRLQERFRESVYGGPTSYALLRSAYFKGIPTFYLAEERLIQYGYGKYQVRGIATTFSSDSHLDSDFTTQKDDCKEFLANCGFPIPQGKTVDSLREALAAAAAIGYPVALKPVAGHKGIGVTANIRDERGLTFAFDKAVEASPYRTDRIIVEKHIAGADFRLLCVGGEFVAALERRPPYVTGDGVSRIAQLIVRENSTPARQDSPTSPLAKIPVDEVMENYLNEQGLSLESIPQAGKVIYLRQVANVSSGGVSVDVTAQVHPDNRRLAEEIAQYFRLVCLGVDVIAQDIARSWKEGEFGAIEINAAPGVFMHLNPAFGESIDVPSRILDELFPPEQPSRLPIFTFNRLTPEALHQIVEQILQCHPEGKVGAVCQQGIWLNHSPKILHPDYNSNLRRLLRYPQLDYLIAEYPQEIFQAQGMAYQGSHLVVLEEPTEMERILARDLLADGTLIVKQGEEVEVQSPEGWERHRLTEFESFLQFYLGKIAMNVPCFLLQPINC
jgi:cyanophycin synthetase